MIVRIVVTTWTLYCGQTHKHNSTCRKQRKNECFKKANYVKIHETAKSEPVLIATKRRISLLQAEIKKMKDTKTEISYVCHDGTNASIVLDLSTIQYSALGANKKEEMINNNEIRSITTKVQLSLDKLVLGLSTFDELGGRARRQV